MKRPQLVSSGSLDRMMKAAGEAWSRREFQQAIEILERASRLNPGNPIVLMDLGYHYGLRYNYADAERCFEKAIQLAPAKAKALVMIGEKCFDFATHQMAEHYFKRALAEKDVSPDACVILSEIVERQNRLEEANALVDRALQMNASCGLALLARARLNRQAGRLEEAEKTVRSLLSLRDPGAQESRERDTRVRGWYELGAILDRQQRYDEAMAAWVQAKSMQRLHAVQQLAELNVTFARLKQFRESLSAELLRSWHDLGPQLQPPRRLAFLGGHPRSGTTLIEQVLDSHPEIVSAEETTIFNDDAVVPMMRALSGGEQNQSLVVSTLQQSREAYFRSMESHLGQPVGSRLLIDKNPVITILIPLLARVFPEMKFLVALRDPRDVCLSNFMQANPLRQDKGPAGNRAGYLSLEGTITGYAVMMNMWMTAAPLMKNPWLEIRYEDVVNDLESTSRRVLEFLGVSWDPNVLHFDEHARQKTVRTPSYADVTKPVFKTAVGRWHKYQKYFEPYMDKLAPFAKKFGYE